MVHFHQLYPLHPEIKIMLNRAEKIVSLENNATGQFAKVLELYAGVKIAKDRQFLKYIGEPYMVEEIQEWLLKESA